MSGAINSQSFVSSVNVQSRFGEAMNIPELIMAVQIQRGNVLENQVKDQIDDMQKRNEWLKTANDALAALRTNRPTDKDGRANFGEFTDKEGKAVSVIDFMDANGVKSTEEKYAAERPALREAAAKEGKTPEYTGTQAEFDTAITNLKGAVDTVNSQSQMDMVRLQGLMDKRNQSFDMLTNSLSKFSKSMDSVIGNMR